MSDMLVHPDTLRDIAKTGVQEFTENAPPGTRCIVFVFNNEGGPVACVANVSGDRVQVVLKDYLQHKRQNGLIVVPE